MFKTLTMKAFISNVGISFLKVIPAYPFLAVIIIFVFLFVISFFESLHLPTQWLNWPIYYGTQYGPFVWVYMSVKQWVLTTKRRCTECLPNDATRYGDITLRSASGESFAHERWEIMYIRLGNGYFLFCLFVAYGMLIFLLVVIVIFLMVVIVIFLMVVIVIFLMVVIVIFLLVVIVIFLLVVIVIFLLMKLYNNGRLTFVQ